MPETRHTRHCATPQTYFCHHRGKGVETFDLEIHKVNSMPLWLLSAFFPRFICQHPSPSFKKKKKRKSPHLSYCLFKLACLPQSIPSTVSVRGLKARLVHCFTSETVCVFVSSGSPGEWKERDRVGRRVWGATYGLYDECRRGQYMFSVMREWGILEEARKITNTHTHTDSSCLTCVA